MRERIIELEIKVAYQEKTLGELSDVVLRQQQHIDRLEKELERLRRQVATAGGIEGPPDESPPPHY